MHLYTTDRVESERSLKSGEWVSEGIAGHVFDRQVTGTTPLYRLYKQLNGGPEHFYTIKKAEADAAVQKYGYQAEGIQCYVAATQIAGTSALYRLSSNRWGHFYTTNAQESATAQSQGGFTAEGQEGYVWLNPTTSSPETAQVGVEPPVTPLPPQQDGKSTLSAHRRITGKLTCVVPNGSSRIPLPIPRVPVEVAGATSTTTKDSGSFEVAGLFTGMSVSLGIRYDGKISDGSVETRLQVMDDVHATRRDSFVRQGAASGDALDIGVIQIDSPDCEIWRIGVKLLNDYHFARHAPPPAKQLRIKRFSGVVVGTPHTFYDYIVLRTDFTSAKNTISDRESTLFHEFGHTIRHVADGNEAHWNLDNFRWAYARNHDTTEITNVQYAFNEGWANYWRAARFSKLTVPQLLPAPLVAGAPLAAGYRDWNEILVANRLLELSRLPGSNDSMMIQVLEANPGAIHSLYEFEQKLFDRIGMPPPPAPSSCPPLYTDDGATCRRDVEALTKPSYTRGVGTAPRSCPAGQELDAGLCYSQCKPGYHGVGPVCWGTCPAGYSDDGATCRRDAHIVSADNSKCPGYDKCGLTFAKGCSKCPAGYSNDGCTCRKDAYIFGKSSYGRGAGAVPTACAPGQEYDAGLCYAQCKPGFHGVGPVCWGKCKIGYDDHGGTCYRGTSIIVKY